MIRKTTGYLLLAGAALWYLILRGVNAVKVTFDSVSIGTPSADGINMSLSVLIHNPLLVSLTIQNITGDVYVQDILAAKVDTPVNQRLSAMETNRVYANFALDTVSLGKALGRNIQTGDINSLTLYFDGYVTVNGIDIPVSRTFLLGDLLQ